MDWLSRNLWSLVHELALVQGSSRPPPLNPGFTTTFSMACSAFYSNHEIVGATRTNLNKIKSVMPVSCLPGRSEEHTSELQSQFHLVCRLLLEKKKKNHNSTTPIKKKK